MTLFTKWFSHLLSKLTPAPEGNAWDEYKRARHMTLPEEVSHVSSSNSSRYERLIQR